MEKHSPSWEGLERAGLAGTHGSYALPKDPKSTPAPSASRSSLEERRSADAREGETGS